MIAQLTLIVDILSAASYSRALMSAIWDILPYLRQSR